MQQAWNTLQKKIFLERLINHSNAVSPFEENVLKSLDKCYNFTACNNSEVKFLWQILCLKSQVNWIVPHVVNFITSQGRMKFVRPLYRALKNCPLLDGERIARETFQANMSM